jgi:hypothetical protein
MKRTILILIISLSIFSCKKTYENAVEEAVISAITTGAWKVSDYNKGGTSLTASFSEYKFIFQNNRSVDAIRHNTVEATGSWEENAATRTITAQFTNTGEPLTLLNGVWNITKNSWTFVEATQTINGEVRKLRLDKE